MHLKTFGEAIQIFFVQLWLLEIANRQIKPYRNIFPISYNSI